MLCKIYVVQSCIRASPVSAFSPKYNEEFHGKNLLQNALARGLFLNRTTSNEWKPLKKK